MGKRPFCALRSAPQGAGARGRGGDGASGAPPDPGRPPAARGSLAPRFPSASEPRGPAPGGTVRPLPASHGPLPGAVAGARSRSPDTSLPRTWSRTGRPWGRGTAASEEGERSRASRGRGPRASPAARRSAPARPGPPRRAYPEAPGSSSGIFATVTELHRSGGSGRDFGTAVGWPRGHVGEMPLQLERLTGLEQSSTPAPTPPTSVRTDESLSLERDLVRFSLGIDP